MMAGQELRGLVQANLVEQHGARRWTSYSLLLPHEPTVQTGLQADKECLELLLRGTAPVVICPARSIERMRLPAAWRTPLDEERLLVCSPFTAPYRRPTASLAEQRNRLVAALADAVVIAHASSGSKSAWLSAEMVASGKRVYTLDLPENGELMEHGVKGHTVPALVRCLVGHEQSDESS
jgi:hypothetical protein